MEKQFTADRVSCKYRVIYGELVLDEIWVSQDCGELESHSAIAQKLESQAKKIFEQSTCKRTERQETKVEPRPEPKTETKDISSSLPRCPKCQSPMKLNKKMDYWNCSMAVWQDGADGKKINVGCRGFIKVT